MVEQLDRAQKIEKAVKILRVKGLDRHYQSAANLNSMRLRALGPFGLCGECKHLNLSITNDKAVDIDCYVGLSPINLQTKTELGQKAECEKFEPEGK